MFFKCAPHFWIAAAAILAIHSNAEASVTRIYSINSSFDPHHTQPLSVAPGRQIVQLAADDFTLDWFGSPQFALGYDVEDYIWTTSLGEVCDPGHDQASPFYDCLQHTNIDVTPWGVQYYVPFNMGAQIIISAQNKYTGRFDSVTLVNPYYGQSYKPIVFLDPDLYHHNHFDMYDALGVHGRIVIIGGKKHWKPYYTRVGWQPFRYGHWEWDVHYGWTWVSEDDEWGSYTDHYGYWINDPWEGWVWYFDGDYTYRPHRVTFFSHGDHIGWYPHGPHGHVWIDVHSDHFFFFGITVVHYHHYALPHVYHHHFHDKQYTQSIYNQAKLHNTGAHLHPYGNDPKISYDRIRAHLGEGRIAQTRVISKRLGDQSSGRELLFTERSIEVARERATQSQSRADVLMRENVRVGSSIEPSRGGNPQRVVGITTQGRGLGTPAVMRGDDGILRTQAPRSRQSTRLDGVDPERRAQINERMRDLERNNPRIKRDDQPRRGGNAPGDQPYDRGNSPNDRGSQPNPPSRENPPAPRGNEPPRGGGTQPPSTPGVTPGTPPRGTPPQSPGGVRPGDAPRGKPPTAQPPSRPPAQGGKPDTRPGNPGSPGGPGNNGRPSTGAPRPQQGTPGTSRPAPEPKPSSGKPAGPRPGSASGRG